MAAERDRLRRRLSFETFNAALQSDRDATFEAAASLIQTNVVGEDVYFSADRGKSLLGQWMERFEQELTSNVSLEALTLGARRFGRLAEASVASTTNRIRESACDAQGDGLGHLFGMVEQLPVEQQDAASECMEPLLAQLLSVFKEYPETEGLDVVTAELHHQYSRSLPSNETALLTYLSFFLSFMELHEGCERNVEHAVSVLKNLDDFNTDSQEHLLNKVAAWCFDPSAAQPGTALLLLSADMPQDALISSTARFLHFMEGLESGPKLECAAGLLGSLDRFDGESREALADRLVNWCVETEGTLSKKVRVLLGSPPNAELRIMCAQKFLDLVGGLEPSVEKFQCAQGLLRSLDRFPRVDRPVLAKHAVHWCAGAEAENASGHSLLELAQSVWSRLSLRCTLTVFGALLKGAAVPGVVESPVQKQLCELFDAKVFEGELFGNLPAGEQAEFRTDLLKAGQELNIDNDRMRQWRNKMANSFNCGSIHLVRS